MVKKEKKKRSYRNIASVPVVLNERTQINYTLAWSDEEELVLDIREYYQYFNWKEEIATGEMRPTRKGFCKVATDEYIDKQIDALRKIKEIKKGVKSGRV